MLVIGAEVGLNVGEGRQRAVRHVSEILAHWRDVSRVHNDRAGGVPENVLTAIAEVLEGGGRTAVRVLG